MSLRYDVILPSYQHVGLPRGLAPFRFNEENFACISTTPVRPTSPAHLIIHFRSAQPVTRGQQLSHKTEFSGPAEPFQTRKRLATISLAKPRQNGKTLLKSYKLFKETYITLPIHSVKICRNSDTLARVVNYFLNIFSHYHPYCTCCTTENTVKLYM